MFAMAAAVVVAVVVKLPFVFVAAAVVELSGLLCWWPRRWRCFFCIALCAVYVRVVQLIKHTTCQHVSCTKLSSSQQGAACLALMHAAAPRACGLSEPMPFGRSMPPGCGQLSMQPIADFNQASTKAYLEAARLMQPDLWSAGGERLRLALVNMSAAVRNCAGMSLENQKMVSALYCITDFVETFLESDISFLSYEDAELLEDAMECGCKIVDAMNLPGDSMANMPLAFTVPCYNLVIFSGLLRIPISATYVSHPAHLFSEHGRAMAARCSRAN